MALFFVHSKDNPKKTYGVYKVIAISLSYKNFSFLIWDGEKWDLVHAGDYVPDEFDDVFGDRDET